MEGEREGGGRRVRARGRRRKRGEERMEGGEREGREREKWREKGREGKGREGEREGGERERERKEKRDLRTKTRYLNPSISDIRNLYGLIMTSVAAAGEREDVSKIHHYRNLH